MHTVLLLLGLLHPACALSASRGAPLIAPIARLRGGGPEGAPMVKLAPDVYHAMAEKGAANANVPPLKAFHQAFMGGLYVAIGGVFALTAAGAMPNLGPELQRMVIGALFPIGLIFILLAAGQLMTGNFAIVTAAWYEGKVTALQALQAFSISGLGNALGCGAMAAAISSAGLLKGGVAEVAAASALKKCNIAPLQVFIRAVLANWLVSMAIFLASAATDMPGKILGIWACIPMFVTVGLEHSVANMFFLPLGMMAGADITMGQIVTKNLILVTLGNLVGAGGLLAAGMSFQFGALGA